MTHFGWSLGRQAATHARRRAAWYGLAGAVFFCAISMATAASGFKVVANTSVTVSQLTRADASHIFMKKQTKWKDGSPILPVDQALSSDVREAFSKEVHGKNAAAVDAYWQKQIFSGRGLPPVTKSSDADVIAYVRANAGAIGYVSAGADTTGVKVIAIQ